MLFYAMPHWDLFVAYEGNKAKNFFLYSNYVKTVLLMQLKLCSIIAVTILYRTGKQSFKILIIKIYEFKK